MESRGTAGRYMSHVTHEGPAPLHLHAVTDPLRPLRHPARYDLRRVPSLGAGQAAPAALRTAAPSQARVKLALPSLCCCAITLTVVGCGSGSGAPDGPAYASPPTHGAAASKPLARGPRVRTHSSRYGRILTDGGGRTLYLFTRDTSPRSRCYGQCAKAWPPLLARGKPGAGRGAHARLVGTTRRRDGSVQVTYRGHPLYYYVGDRRPGDVLCQNVVEYGGTWLVADPAGRPIH
jgi:predicted lipoprotein with Yx(FWY)xxD motif